MHLRSHHKHTHLCSEQFSEVMEDRRYPISVRLVGVMHKEKRKMYIVSVLWSDQNDIVVYRTFRDFQNFHKQMKKAFPVSSKLKKSDRVIPTFRYKRMKHRGQKKGPTKTVVRLKFLQKYCNDLLSCDPRVCQSADLIQFFHPNDKDLQPEFSKNSIMVMPSEDELRADLGQVGGGNVTQPFVTETYRCVAAYETKDTKNKPFKVAPDEKLDVLIKDKAGWWLVENEEKRMAWFPAPYLEKLDDDNTGDEDEMDGASTRGMLYTAIKSYKATKDDEITVSIGSVVEIMQKSDDGWWLVRYNDKAGYIPTVYLKPYSYPHIRLTPSLHDHQSVSHLQIPSLSLGQQSQQFSRSQGNLLEMPSSRPSSPLLLKPESKQRSRSLNVLSERSPTPAAVTTADAGPRLGSAQRPTPPTITVEMDEGEEHQRRGLETYSQGSFDSESDFSLSDDLSSSGGSSINLSVTDDQMRLSRTPPPPSAQHLSPFTGSGGRMVPSVSDPNLYKGPTTPQVPPRPRAQDILTRCSTITRKNAAKGSLSPTQTEISY